jgi:hypothetical protein
MQNDALSSNFKADITGTENNIGLISVRIPNMKEVNEEASN